MKKARLCSIFISEWFNLILDHIWSWFILLKHLAVSYIIFKISILNIYIDTIYTYITFLWPQSRHSQHWEQVSYLHVYWKRREELTLTYTRNKSYYWNKNVIISKIYVAARVIIWPILKAESRQLQRGCFIKKKN